MDSSMHKMISWNFEEQSSTGLYVYDPYSAIEFATDTPNESQIMLSLSLQQRIHYQTFKKALDFHHHYRQFTGRTYFPSTIRQGVSHHMWDADYFGQQHTISTRETHLVTAPPQHALEPIFESGRSRILSNNQPRLLSDYRMSDTTTMNLTLTVISCRPRVFMVRNFLSDIEVDHLVSQARARDMKQSKLGVDGKSQDYQQARTSTHTWIRREQSQIMDAVYRRAADLLRVDEGLLRSRDQTEHPNTMGKNSIAESLQLVHYKTGQHYATHQVSYINNSLFRSALGEKTLMC